jgi:hypothetical protein
MRDCDKKIEVILQRYLVEINADNPVKEYSRAGKSKAWKNAVTIDIENYAS